MTSEGIVLWIAGLVIAPLFSGQLRNWLSTLSRQTAVILVFVVSAILALLVQFFFGGGLHLPADLADLRNEVAIIFALATAAYNLLFKALPPKLSARLVG
jgi:hypothetical protein